MALISLTAVKAKRTDGVTARVIAGGSRTDRQICRMEVSIRYARGQDTTR